MLIFALIVYALIGYGTAAGFVEECHLNTGIDTSGKVWPEKTPMWFVLTMIFLIWPSFMAFTFTEKTL